MENSKTPTANLPVTNFDPSITYAGASSLNLSESEMKALTAKFDDNDYEITPAGFIYLPQALSLSRLNTVIGVGKWGLLLINVGQQVITDKLIKVFYDGALVIRNCFVSRAVGEASYSPTNANQSYATALEAAKTDCRTRCCKDIGIATDAWTPSFTREWQKKYAIRVKVVKDGKEGIIWRRKDLDPFPNEVGIVADKPNVPSTPAQPMATGSNAPAINELPWLNEGSTDWDHELRLMLEGKTMSQVKKVYRISKKNEETLISIMKQEWQKRLDTCHTTQALSESWNSNSDEVTEYPWLKQMFSDRRDKIVKKPSTTQPA